MPTGRVTFAAIVAESMGGALAPEQYLEAALVPGTLVERRSRQWRMGRWHREGLIIVGRIGFEAAALAELWDDAIGDFTEASRRTGLISPFAIDPQTMRVVFQLRGRDIRARSFTSALQALLNEASPTERWRVTRELHAVSFKDWIAEVDRITVLRLRLERPNPNYQDRRKVRELIEGTNARMAEVVLNAHDEDLQGIDVSDPFVQQAIDHVEQHYGTYVATAERGDEQTTWASGDQGAAEVHLVPADPVTKDVSPAELRRELGDPTIDEEAVAEARRAIADAIALDDAGLLDDEEADIDDLIDSGDDE